MNDRIKERMVEAGFIAPLFVDRAEKLAELIVLETIVVMASACYTQGLQAAITKTCEHFGITND